MMEGVERSPPALGCDRENSARSALPVVHNFALQLCKNHSRVLLARRVSFARGWWQQKLVKSIHTDPREFAIYGKYVACQTLRVP